MLAHEARKILGVSRSPREEGLHPQHPEKEVNTVKKHAKQIITVSLVLVAIASVGIAGIAYAQTQNATTSSTTTSTTTATPNASSCNCMGRSTHAWGHIMMGRNAAVVCHNASSRGQVRAWYQQLPQDQKTALQNDIHQARVSWYQQLPQDQKDKLTTILDQRPQNQKTMIEHKIGVQ